MIWAWECMVSTYSGSWSLLTGPCSQCPAVQVHAYTFRNEDTYLAWTWAVDPMPELLAFVDKEGIDGLFTDFTDTAVAFMHRLARGDIDTIDILTEPSAL
jgi:hypothetical protein